ncbi:MAG: hypothetical protein IKA56_06420 [Clostridia bacterium]|nr:hypothetical protein [Clostridia bacterium]
MHNLTESLFGAIDRISDRHIEECAVFDKSKIGKKENLSFVSAKPKRKKHRIKKTILLAAIISVIASMTLFVGSGGKNTEIEEIQLNIREGIFTLHYEEVEKGTLFQRMNIVMVPSLEINGEAMLSAPEKFSDEAESLVMLHKENGFEELVLPSDFSSEKWAVSEKSFFISDDNQHWNSNIVLESEKGSVGLAVTRKFFLEGSRIIMNYNKPKRAESMVLNGLDVVIVEQAYGSISVEYFTRKTHGNGTTEDYSYSFVFNGYTFEEITEIVRTLP